ncbi:penicillin-binding protein 1C [Luteolibacter sp. GHJ8]|uniref:peptidoglycan glycosyltransferase n=1 Tax=Luteolibacter rhizosphaerae TaxID=2989719 RepID=A0ABT3G157_9BACT|nr:penicillin-binding protein 1C [Luteolibacter rhizosphaerae]MCW1913548.1 penicillin-binding protein 1C [Luteolibacter rhizosphaerae]
MTASRRWYRRKRILLPGVGLAAGLFSWFALPRCFELPQSLMENPAGSPVLLDRNGAPLHHLVLPDFTRSSPVSLQEIPRDLVDCTLAAEDRRFRSHGGVDLLATLRAAKDAALHRRAVSGASTITQQLIKLASPPAPRNLKTKLREAMLARHLEMRWSKDEILIAYLNRLPYGNHRSGPAEAARFYFQKPLTDLSLAENALLAGLPQAPSRLNPIKHPQRALQRREVVLQRLSNQEGKDPARIASARAETLRLRPLPENPVAPWLPNTLGTWGHGDDPRCTIERGLQAEVETIVKEELAKLSGSNLKHAAVVVLDNRSREILALVSSGNWRDPKGGQINGALTPRSPGSTLKPFTWLLAFEKGGLHPASIVADIPTRFRTEQGLDAPENFDRSFRGPVSVREALACSLNVPAMRALNEIGGPRPLHELLLSLGLESIGQDFRSYGLGLTLGNAPVRLLDLTNAYATLASEGVHRPPLLFPAEPCEANNLLDPGSAYLIADILSDAEARAASFGRRGPMELPFRCAAKTGTSSDFRDNWCVGYTAEFTVGVWAGNFDNSPMKNLSGVAGAGPIFHRTMVRMHRDHPSQWLEKPEGLVEIKVDPRTGKRMETGMSSLVPADRLPMFAANTDRDAEGKILLDASYSEWLASEHNRRRSDFTLAKDQPSEIPLRILAPRMGTRYLLDPELPNGGLLHLASNLPGEVEWSSSTLALREGKPEPVAKLKPGKHVLIATDKRNGEKQEVEIVVEER